MGSVAVVGVDSAGGLIVGANQTKVKIGGKPIAIVGCAVAPHGQSPHSAATLVEGSAKVKIGGIPIVFTGKRASCGHPTSAGGKVHCST